MEFEDWLKKYRKEDTCCCSSENVLRIGWNAALENQWQDIDENTPKNRYILVLADRPFVAIWVKNPETNNEGWSAADLGNGEKLLINSKVTLWQETPQPPQG